MEEGRGDVGEGAFAGQCTLEADEDAGDLVGRVGGVGFAGGFVDIGFGIAMIGRDEGTPTMTRGGFDHTLQFTVEGFEGDDERGDIAGVPDHIGVGEVDEEEICSFLDYLDCFVGDFTGAHLGGLVVGENIFTTFDEDMFLARVGMFLTAVQEVGGVGIFFGLGDMGLGESGLGDFLGEGGLEDVRRECDQGAEIGIVFSEGDETDIAFFGMLDNFG